MENNKFSFKLVWGVVMVAAYMAMAYLLIFTDVFKEGIELTYRIIFAILFAFYGLFRGYRLWKSK